MPFKYIKNGKPFVSDEPIYFFEWIYKGGSVSFGMHGTQKEYETATALDKNGMDRKLRLKRPVPEIAP